MPAQSDGIRETVRRANELLKQLRTARRAHETAQARLDNRVTALKERYGPEIEQAQQEEARLRDELLELVVPNFAFLAMPRTRTARFRHGEVSLRDTPESLVFAEGVTDKKVVAWLRKRGLLRKFTRQGERVLDKAALKRAPHVVEQIPGVMIGSQTNVIIRLNGPQGENVIGPDPLKTPLLQEGG